jgi:hypothetical protein
MIRRFALLVYLLAPLCAAAQPIVISSAPQATSVTIYRDPERSGGTLYLHDLRGFALITETRRISLPAGESTLRFEGVADGIMAKSAIILGLPGGVVEKNRDARLLSPAALMEAFIGKEITLRRTSKANGTVQEQRMVVRSGPNGILLEGKDGTEALQCSGLPEALIFDSLPEGLSAKPTLSVRTRSQQAVEATVNLAYLARGFDWSAQYVASINPDGKSLHLTGWVTLANANSSNFVNAGTQVVAGKLNREEDGDVEDYTAGGYSLRCWPWDSTSTYPSWNIIPPNVVGLSVSMSVSAPVIMAMRARGDESDSSSEVIVTAQKVSEEQLGDLKLYRVPFATTVAANAQKQVLLLDQATVPFERLYRSKLTIGQEQHPVPMQAILRTKNNKKNDLGIALPAGAVAIFETVSARSMLAGEDDMRDAAVNEEVEIEVGDAVGVRIGSNKNASGDFIINLSNDHNYVINAEVELQMYDGSSVTSASPRHSQKNGRPIWRMSVPANGTSIIRYAVNRKAGS